MFLKFVYWNGCIFSLEFLPFCSQWANVSLGEFKTIFKLTVFIRKSIHFCVWANSRWDKTVSKSGRAKLTLYIQYVGYASENKIFWLISSLLNLLAQISLNVLLYFKNIYLVLLFSDPFIAKEEERRRLQRRNSDLLTEKTQLENKNKQINDSLTVGIEFG